MTTAGLTNEEYELNRQKRIEAFKERQLEHEAFIERIIKEIEELSGMVFKINTRENEEEGYKAWVFTDIVANEVEQLDELYNDDPVVMDIETIGKRSTLRESIYFCGYPLATAYGRDSGAKLSPDVVMLSGTIGSDGSMKNWGTYCTDDSKFRLTIGRKLLESKREILETKWIITIKE